MPRTPNGIPTPPEANRNLPADAEGIEYVPWHHQPLNDQVSPDGSTMDEFGRILADKGIGVVRYQYPNDFRSLYGHLSEAELSRIRYDDLTDEELRVLGNPSRENHSGTERHPGAVLGENAQSIMDDRGARHGVHYELAPGSFVPGAPNLPEESGREHLESREGVRISPRTKSHGAHRPGAPREYEPRRTEEWGQNVGRHVRESAIVEGAGRTIREIRESLRRDPSKHRRKL